MSYANRRPTNMHCKVCESAKKPMNVITSHNPKNRDGFTVCPTLLAQQCRGCGKKGHTIGYCPKEQKEREDKERQRQQQQQEKEKKKNKEKKEKKMPTAEVKFDVLYESSDDEQEQEAAPIQPQKKEKKVKDPNAKFCWATAESDSSGDESE